MYGVCEKCGEVHDLVCYCDLRSTEKELWLCWLCCEEMYIANKIKQK